MCLEIFSRYYRRPRSRIRASQALSNERRDFGQHPDEEIGGAGASSLVPVDVDAIGIEFLPNEAYLVLGRWWCLLDRRCKLDVPAC